MRRSSELKPSYSDCSRGSNAKPFVRSRPPRAAPPRRTPPSAKAKPDLLLEGHGVGFLADNRKEKPRRLRGFSYAITLRAPHSNSFGGTGAGGTRTDANSTWRIRFQAWQKSGGGGRMPSLQPWKRPGLSLCWGTHDPISGSIVASGLMPVGCDDAFQVREDKTRLSPASTFLAGTLLIFGLVLMAL
jgi:hypothetical protein